MTRMVIILTVAVLLSIGVFGIPQPVITIRDVPIRMAPHTVHVHATSSDLDSSKWQRVKFSWDFGDTSANPLSTVDPRTNRSINLNTDQQGFNAAYIYQAPGTYTITLNIIDELNQRAVTSTIVTILADTREKRFVDARNGQDTNDGLTPESAWETVFHALENLHSNMTLLFHRSDIFPLSASSPDLSGLTNVTLGSYGTGTKPVLRLTTFESGGGENNDVIIQKLGGGSIISDLKFETDMVLENDTNSQAAVFVNDDLTVWSCTTQGEKGGFGFRHTLGFIFRESGVFVLNSDFGRTHRGSKFSMKSGGDWVVTGTKALGGDKQFILRTYSETDKTPDEQNPAQRINISWCSFDNQIETKGTTGTIRFTTGRWLHLFRNQLLNGQIDVSFNNFPLNTLVVDGCFITHGKAKGVQIRPNSADMMFRNNVFEITRDKVRAIDFLPPQKNFDPKRDIETLDIVNCTFRSMPRNQNGQILELTQKDNVGALRDFKIMNNLFVVDPSFVTHTSGIVAVTPNDVILKHNVFPDFSDTFVYARINGEDVTWTEITTNPEFVGNRWETIPLASVDSPDFRPDPASFTTTAEAGLPVGGIFKDYHGVQRPNDAEAFWSAGAVESTPAPISKFNASPMTGEMPLAVNFDASPSLDLNGTIVSYDWDFADGNSGEGISPSHTFTQPDTYSVTLTITDNDGLTGSETRNIIVIPPRPGTINLGAAKIAILEEIETVAVSITRSAGSAGAGSVRYSTQAGTSTPDADYIETSGVVVFEDGEGGEKTFSISIIDDDLNEGNETIRIGLEIESGKATLGLVSEAILTIVDDDFDLFSDLQARWQFDSMSGTKLIDTTGNGSSGDLIDDPEWTMGRLQGALHFDGEASYVHIENAPQLNPEETFTLTLWAKATDRNEPGVLVSKGNGGSQYELVMTMTELIFSLGVNGGSKPFSVPFTFQPEIWYHIAGVYSESAVKLYVDGEQIGSTFTEIGVLLPSNGIALTIGKRAGSAGDPDYFSGTIDDVRLYHRDLNEVELANLATSIPKIIPPGDREIECGDPVDPTINLTLGLATIQGTCGTTPPAIEYHDTSSLDTCSTEISREWKVTDLCGNSASAIQTITQLDRTPPVLVIPDDLTVACTDVINPSKNEQLDTATATDRCNLTIVNFTDDRTGGCPDTIRRHWSAVDSCGNEQSLTQTISVDKLAISISIEQPTQDHEIEYGECLEEVRAFIEDEFGNEVNVLTTIKFINTSNGFSETITRSSEGGVLELVDGYRPNSAGNWEIHIEKEEDNSRLGASFFHSFSVIKTPSIVDLSSLSGTAIVNEALAIVGRVRLNRRNACGVTLDKIPIDATLTPPSGDEVELPRVWSKGGIGSNNGRFDIIIDENVLNTEGDWTLRVETPGNESITPSSSETLSIPARLKPGYAILCQGSVPGGEGLSEHQNTLDFVRSTLKVDGRGLDESDINFIPADTPEPEQALRDAIENWAREKMLEIPAPLYLVLVNHGETEKFHINPDVLTPVELDSMLVNLRTSLADNALAENETFIIVLGMCFSGSFIEPLSQPGRIIISAAAPEERSIRGPGEVDDRQGEYFVYLLFRELGTGSSLLDSFRTSRDFIRQISSNFDLSKNGIDPLFPTELGQHALLDDNGDRSPSHRVSRTTGDGTVANTIHLVSPDNAFGRFEIARTNPSIFLGSEAETPQLWAEVDENPSSGVIKRIIMEVKMPSTSTTEGTESMQAKLNLTRQLMEPDADVEDRTRYTWPGFEPDLDLFTDPGEYQVFFYAELGANNIPTEPGITNVFRAGDSTPPIPFDLRSPENQAQVDFESPGKLGVFTWEESQSNTQNVHYIFRLWRDQAKIDLFLESPPIVTNFFQLTLEQVENTTFWWDVVAVDDTGSFTFSKSVYEVTFLSTNVDLPGFIGGKVFDRDTGEPIPNIDVIVSNEVERHIHFQTGEFLIVVSPSPDPISVTFKADNYIDFEQNNIAVNSLAKIVFDVSLIKKDKPLEWELSIHSSPITNIPFSGSFSGMTEHRSTLQDGTHVQILSEPIVMQDRRYYKFDHWLVNGAINDRDTTEVQLVLDRNTVLRAIYLQTTGIRVADGWNLISLPFSDSNVSGESIFDRLPIQPNAVWIWNEGKFEKTLETAPGSGCWVRANKAKFIDVESKLPGVTSQFCNKGWNLIGSIGADPLDLSDDPDIVGTIWAWNRETQTYFSISSNALDEQDRYKLLPGDGYWMYLKSPKVMNLKAQ